MVFTVVAIVVVVVVIVVVVEVDFVVLVVLCVFVVIVSSIKAQFLTQKRAEAKSRTNRTALRLSHTCLPRS